MYSKQIALAVIYLVAISVRGSELSAPRNISDRIENTEIEVDQLQSEFRQLKQQILEFHGKCAVRYGDSCYFAILVNPGQVNQEAAKLLCEKKGAHPGNIYSTINYNLIMDYLRPWIGSRVDSGTSIGIRTGMTINPQSEVVYFSDGTQAGFKLWANNQPYINSRYTTVYLNVNPDGNKGNGMATANPLGGNFGVLCQIPF